MFLEAIVFQVLFKATKKLYSRGSRSGLANIKKFNKWIYNIISEFKYNNRYK
jgi:hypothetical protein